MTSTAKLKKKIFFFKVVPVRPKSLKNQGFQTLRIPSGGNGKALDFVRWRHYSGSWECQFGVSLSKGGSGSF